MSEPKCVTHFDGCACVTAHRVELGHTVQRLERERDVARKELEVSKGIMKIEREARKDLEAQLAEAREENARLKRLKGE